MVLALTAAKQAARLPTEPNKGGEWQQLRNIYWIISRFVNALTIFITEAWRKSIRDPRRFSFSWGSARLRRHFGFSSHVGEAPLWDFTFLISNVRWKMRSGKWVALFGFKSTGADLRNNRVAFNGGISYYSLIARHVSVLNSLCRFIFVRAVLNK